MTFIRFRFQANKAAGINPAYKPVLEALLDPNKLAAMRQIEMDLKSELKNRLITFFY